MKITFWGKNQGDWIVLESATKLEKRQTKCNGRLTNFWFVYFGDGKTRSFKCNCYDLISVENY